MKNNGVCENNVDSQSGRLIFEQDFYLFMLEKKGME